MLSNISLFLPVMERKEDVNRDPVSTTVEFSTDIKMEDNAGGRGGEEGEVKCQISVESSMTGLIHDNCEIQGKDVNFVAKQLMHLDDVGNREKFHLQCCEVSCCVAKEVIQIMRNQSYKMSLLQVTSETFLLQDLLNPTHYGCTEELLSSWLLVQEDEDQGTDTILENINKMLALVGSSEHLVIFLRSILKRFGSRFLGLCASLALRALKQQRHLTNTDGNQMDNCSRKKLAQTVELIGQMYYGKCRNLYLSCLLTLLYIDPSDIRYFALETYFVKSTDDGKVSRNVDSSVDLGIYSDLLSAVNLLRPMSLDLELDWLHLKVIAMDLLYRAGYHYEPANNVFHHRETLSSKVCCNWNRLGISFGVCDNSGSTTESSASNGEKMKADANTWRCSSGNLSSDIRTMTWSLSDHFNSSQSPRSFCQVAKSEDETTDKDLKSHTNGNCLTMTSVDSPDSTSTDLITPVNEVCHFPTYGVDCSVNGSTLDSTVIRTYSDDRQKFRTSWHTINSKDNDSNSVDIVSTENEDEINAKEENPAYQISSTYPNKQSVSADVPDVFCLPQELEEPCNGFRPVNSRCSRILRRNRDKDVGDQVRAEMNAQHSALEEISYSSQPLRPKDRLERVQAPVMRRTFFFKYTFPKKLHAKDGEKRSVNEGEVIYSDRISMTKSKYMLPNGIKLKKCFIRLNRIEARSREQETKARISVSEEMEQENEIKEDCVMLDESSLETNLIKEKTEEKVVECVCDGCGQVVPDCSWLTAHIVTCTGRPDCDNSDDNTIMDDELAGSFRPDAPIWDSLENRKVETETTAVVFPTTDVSDVDRHLKSIESSNDIASFSTQNSSEVDPADFVNLIQNHDGTSSSSSSIIYETTTSNSVGGIKVFQISNGSTSYSMSNHQQSVINDVSDDQLGKEIVYNGVYMYEFSEYQCNMCLLAFASQSAAADHVQSSDHRQSTISRNSFCCCHKCSIRYSEKHIMWLHSQYTCGNAVAELTDESRFYRCLLCSKAFLSSAFLRRHIYLQHGREFVAAVQQQVLATAEDVNNMSQLSMQSFSQLSLSDDAPRVASHFNDYGVGLNNSLIGGWYQNNEEANQLEDHTLEEQPVNVFPKQTQDAVETTDLENFLQAKDAERSVMGRQDSVSVSVSGDSESADSRALLDRACSIVLGGCSNHNTTNFSETSTSVSPSHPAPATTISSSKSTSSSHSRRIAKGIMYKNVFMQCIVNYLCSTCKKDLSTKASKKEHKSSPCFDADSNRFTYLRQYSYLCPYCSEKFPSQKFCRQHQLTVCLQLMGVKTDELNHKQLLCPFCDRKYFNIITLKGHMTLIHKVNKINSSHLLGSSGLLDELISYAPDGLSEKAKDAKKKVKDENERRELEANSSFKEDINLKKQMISIKNLSVDRKLEISCSKEMRVNNDKTENVEISETVYGISADQRRSRNQSDVENGMSHEYGQECSLTDVICNDKGGNIAEIEVAEEMDQSDLHIDAKANDLTFDSDASNDVTSTGELSEFDDELSCQGDISSMKTEPHEYLFKKSVEAGDGKKSLRQKKSISKKKLVTKSSRKLH